MANIAGYSGVVQEVDATSRAGRSTLYDPTGNLIIGADGQNLPTNPYGLLTAGSNDGTFRLFRSDRAGNMRMGMERLLFRDTAESVAVSGTPIAPNLNQWSTAVSGFAVGLPIATGNQLTATSVTTSGSYAIATSLRSFQKVMKQPLFYRRRGRNVIYTNTCAEFGFGIPATTTAIIPNSAHWRYTSSGQVLPVLTYASGEITGVDISASLNSANYYTWDIIVDDDSVLFVCQDVTTGHSISEQTLHIGSAARSTWQATHLPIFERVYNSGTAAQAPTVLFSDIYVASLDIHHAAAWNHQLVGATQGGAEVYPGAFVAANAQTAQYANSAAASNATLGNTAASYTTLGGNWQFAAVAGAETDFPLFGFTVPAPFTLYVTGIRISSFNFGAAVATTPSLLQWAVANNSSAVSLATAGLTRTTVGVQSFAVGAAVGAAASDIDMAFETPLRTDGGRIFHVILRMPVGTNTASQVLRGMVAVRGYFE